MGIFDQAHQEYLNGLAWQEHSKSTLQWWDDLLQDVEYEALTINVPRRLGLKLADVPISEGAADERTISIALADIHQVAVLAARHGCGESIWLAWSPTIGGRSRTSEPRVPPAALGRPTLPRHALAESCHGGGINNRDRWVQRWSTCCGPTKKTLACATS